MTAGPSTPSAGSTPASPSSPAAPATPGPGLRAGPRGAPIKFTRQSTSKEILDLDWHFPVLHTFEDRAGKESKTTRAAFVERALPRQEAFLKLNNPENKPLLVMRECVLCKGTDHALFSRRLDNEKTMLLCQWFHCVKLPPRVLEANHPFRNLFESDHPSHLFICNWDGSEATSFDGKQPQSKLQDAMLKLLDNAYAKSPKPALKSMLSFLSKFDSLDGLLEEARARLQKEMTRPRASKANLDKLKKRIDELTAERDAAMKQAKAVCDLKLIVKKPEAEGAGAPAAPAPADKK